MVEPTFEDFLPKRASRGKFVLVFDIGGGFLPPKPLGLEVGIDMCCSHLLDFLYYHIYDEEGGKMMVNLPHIKVIYKK